jgi:hypothetical protein
VDRQFIRKFKFPEHDDDDRLAIIAKEKSRFGLDRRAFGLASVAEFAPRPHQ